jgi:F420H(2)-dependent biliverdin reductase
VNDELASTFTNNDDDYMKLTHNLESLDPAVLTFLTEFHVALLTTTRSDGRFHSAGVGFTYDHELRTCFLIGQHDSVKVRNIVAAAQGGAPVRAILGQVDGSRWLSLEGLITVSDDPDVVADAERRYKVRYPGHGNPMEGRVAMLLQVESIVGIPWKREPNNK